MTTPLTVAEREALAVFPLPRVVLFPGARLALHLFEPRYLAMMDDCIEHGRMVMAMAQLRPGWRAEYEGRPPVHEVAGAGRIVQHQRNPNGTYDLELEGIARVRLHELPVAGLAYRRARVDVLDDVVPVEGVPAATTQALWLLASQVAAHVRRIDERFSLAAEPSDAPSRLADRIADQLLTDPDVRQQALETLDVPLRIELVRTQLARLQLALLANEPSAPRTLH